jgi:DNA-binding CsgD family transcriptional regulator
MQVTRPASASPLTVLVTPFRADGMFSPLRPLAAIFVTDPNQAVRPRQEVLRKFYGLTPAEIRLSCLLAEGKGLREVADRIGVTHETARSQLKSIFGKTNTGRQSELVRLLTSLPAE